MEMLTQAFDELCFGDSETSCLIQARREHGAQTGGGGSYLSVAKNRLMKGASDREDRQRRRAHRGDPAEEGEAFG